MMYALEKPVKITAGAAMLDGDLAMPPGAAGIVVFAHGSGSSRHSTRNRYVAGEIQKAGIATLLMDLLTVEEEEQDAYTRHLRFDIPLLADRLTAAREWLRAQDGTRGLPVGLFGASTGAAAALVSAAKDPNGIAAIVSRGGRPDLAGDGLLNVKAPTLLLVGGDDVPVIGMNQDAMARMEAPVEIVIVPGATHLFEEPGTLEEVAKRATEWFRRHMEPPNLGEGI